MTTLYISYDDKLVTKLMRNNFRLRCFVEKEIPLRRRRQSFRFTLVTTVLSERTEEKGWKRTEENGRTGTEEKDLKETEEKG